MRESDKENWLQTVGTAFGACSFTLTEECMLAKGSDPTFTSKLTTIHADHPHLIKERLSKVEFR